MTHTWSLRIFLLFKIPNQWNQWCTIHCFLIYPFAIFPAFLDLTLCVKGGRGGAIDPIQRSPRVTSNMTVRFVRMIRVSGCFAVLQCSGSPVSPKQSAWFFGFSPWIKDSFFPILGVSNLVIGFDFGSWRPQLVGQENLSNFCQQRGWRATEILESLKHHFERISHSLTIFTIHCLFSR